MTSSLIDGEKLSICVSEIPKIKVIYTVSVWQFTLIKYLKKLNFCFYSKM